MASALITIDQVNNPQPVGIPGRARDDLALGDLVTLRNSDNTDVTRHIWAMLDKPIGSFAALSTVTGAQTTFVPDVAGMYRVRLIVNGGLAGERDTRCAGVRDPFDRLYPAAGQRAEEANYDVGGSPNDNGWAKEVERILRSLAVPQLLNATQAEGVAVAGSVNVIVGAIGLPSSSAQVTGYDFVDLQGGANAGVPPTVNGESFVETAGFNGLSAICVTTVDLDTSGTTINDVWAMIMLTDTTPLLLSKLTIV